MIQSSCVALSCRSQSSSQGEILQWCTTSSLICSLCHHFCWTMPEVWRPDMCLLAVPAPPPPQLLSKCSFYLPPFVQIHMKAIAQKHLLNATGVAAFPTPGAVMGRWSVLMKNLMTTTNWVVTVLVEGFFRPFMGPSPLQLVRVKVSPVFGLWILRTPGRWVWNCKSWR